ncbi:MAG: hypothetical protein IJ320_05135 [Phascolarctobacterium sp.]|nr:hypothetical protein [Phascolarctobacterium sp.]
MANVVIDNQIYTLKEGKRFIRNDVYAFDLCVLQLKETNEYYLEIFKEDDFNHKNQVITIPISMLTKILPDILDYSHTYGISSNQKDSNDKIIDVQKRPVSLLEKHPDNRWKEIASMLPKLMEAATIHANKMNVKR